MVYPVEEKEMNRTCSIYKGNKKSLEIVSRIKWHVAISLEISIPPKENQEVATIQLIREN